METLLELYDNCLEYLSNVINKGYEYDEKQWLLHYVDNVQRWISTIAKECDSEIAENERWNKRYGVNGFNTYCIREIYDCSKVAEKYGLDRNTLKLGLQDIYENDSGDALYEYLKNKMMYPEVNQKSTALYFELMQINCQSYEVPDSNASEYTKLCYACITAQRLNRATYFLDNAYLFEKQTAAKIDSVMKKYLGMDFNSDNSCKPLPSPPPACNEISFKKATLIGGGCGAIPGIALSTLKDTPLLAFLFIGAGIIISNILRVKKNRTQQEIYNKKYDVYSKQKEEIEKENRVLLSQFYNRFSRKFLNQIEDNLEDLTFVLQSLTVACTNLLQLPMFDFLPEKYKYSATALGAFAEYYNDKRVSSIQEAVNLYVSELRENEHREEMRRLEQMRLEEQQKAIRQQQKQEAERNQILRQMKQVVSEIGESERENERQRQKDAEALKESLSNATQQVKETKDKLADLKRETDDLKKMLED